VAEYEALQAEIDVLKAELDLAGYGDGARQSP
jgi:hypothetical protein